MEALALQPEDLSKKERIRRSDLNDTNIAWPDGGRCPGAEMMV